MCIDTNVLSLKTCYERFYFFFADAEHEILTGNIAGATRVTILVPSPPNARILLVYR